MEKFSDLPDSPKKPKRKHTVLSSLSSSRIASQSNKSGVPTNTVPVPLLPANKRFRRKDPGRMPPIHRKCYQQLDQSQPDQESMPDPVDNDSDSGLPSKPESKEPKASTSNTKSDPSPDNNNRSTGEGAVFPKGAFKTTQHGIKITKKIRYFKCPECGIHKKSTMGLNEHYKRQHKAIQCEKCDMIYTPSGYDRHKYVHLEPRHKCDQCGKEFHFLGELHQHSTVH